MASNGILADDDDDEAGDEQRHDEIEQRDQPDIDPGAAVRPARRAIRRRPSATPAISRPSSRSSASGAALAHDAPGEHHQDAVGERADLVELDRDQQHRPCPRRAAAMMRLWMNSMAPMSTPRVGWPTISRSGSRSISRARTIFCWLPPENLARLEEADRAGARRTPPSRRGPRAIDLVAVEPEALAEALVVVPAEDGALAGSKELIEAAVLAVLRHMGEAVLRAHGAGRPACRCPCLRRSPAPDVGLAMPAITSSSSDWPLPATPAMPTISPARTSKRHIVDARRCPCSSFTGEVLHLEHRPRRAWPGPSPRAAARGGRPSARPVPRRWCSAVSRVATISPRRMTETRVGDRHDLAQLVGDEDDGLALVAQRAEDAEQMIGLVGRQHAGGLVEDQDVGAAVQRLEDLDALLQADGQVADQRVGIDVEFVVVREARRARCGPWRAPGRSARRPRRRARRSRAR